MLGYVSVDPWDPTRRVFPLQDTSQLNLGILLGVYFHCSPRGDLQRGARGRRPRPRARFQRTILAPQATRQVTRRKGTETVRAERT